MHHSQSYWSRVWQHFKRNILAVVGLWVSVGLLLVALFADILANDKPYYMVYQGKTFFPILESYLDSLGIAPLPSDLRQADFATLSAERAIYPPIRYRPNRINLLAPLAEPSGDHWLGTDKLGRDVLSGLIHGSRISLSIGFLSVGTWRVAPRWRGRAREIDVPSRPCSWGARLALVPTYVRRDAEMRLPPESAPPESGSGFADAAVDLLLGRVSRHSEARRP
jgi:hypothetical protein